MSSFGERLRKERERAGLTQIQLAEKSGVSVRTITRLEAADEPTGQQGTIKALEEAIGVPLSLESMVDKLPDITEIILSCRAVVKNKDRLDRADLKAIRSSLEWVLDTLKKWSAEEPGDPIDDGDID